MSAVRVEQHPGVRVVSNPTCRQLGVDGDLLEGFWDLGADFRVVLRHVDPDAILAILPADPDADDATHLHEAGLVSALDVLDGSHRGSLGSSGR